MTQELEFHINPESILRSRYCELIQTGVAVLFYQDFEGLDVLTTQLSPEELDLVREYNKRYGSGSWSTDKNISPEEDPDAQSIFINDVIQSFWLVRPDKFLPPPFEENK